MPVHTLASNDVPACMLSESDVLFACELNVPLFSDSVNPSGPMSGSLL